MPKPAAGYQRGANRGGDECGRGRDTGGDRLLSRAHQRQGASMITGHHYQNAYICADIDAAIAALTARIGPGGHVRQIGPFTHDQTIATPQGMKRVASRLAFVWIDDLQYELIEVLADETGVYGHYQDNGGLMHFHHICTRVSDWDAFRRQVDAQDLPVVLERAGEGDALKFLYLDGRAFCGHYLEYVWMTDERWTQLGGETTC
jgi:hypothetical protein